ncbi:GMC oxidoreductase-domain-containing protein [Xylaria bambusicola]|uniref:GMC oxidoreductase-domain-containing protein n=1 Tax=Xylaria bambusicola TaxID=326684 RepID=UPI0020088BF1|nr:GMC oxidoreductase-domain-containing protein [Xylaria bambusicola]KAI0520804.1 GMC oxidoreductase-domain-containing protein [Xylaria bambusicola]
MRLLLARMLSLCALFCLAFGIHITPNANGSLPLRESYDYIVVGAGIGGLVVANRLSENDSVSVLLVEAGELDDRAEDITVPGNIGRRNPSQYAWAVTTTPQEFLDNKTRTFNQGRVVGGSTILNGLVWTRGAAADYDAWKNLGNPGWGWMDLLPYFLKSENYTMHSNPSFYSKPAQGKHGKHGPVQVGFPRYIYEQTYNFLNGVQELGIPLNADLNSGYATGADFVSGSIFKLNQSRADARTAYLDPVISRPNLELLTGYTVTKILNGVVGNQTSRNLARGLGTKWGEVTVAGVEIAVNSTTPKFSISCKREVILAAGAILSPVLLQISGFGPAEHLKNNLNVDVLVHLPGVGSNLQDHAMIQPVYNYTAPGIFSVLDIDGDTEDAVREEYLANRTGPWTATMVNAVAFPALGQILSQRLHVILNSSARDLPPSYDATLRAGYEAQETEEIMATSWGQLAVSAMHTLSRGTIHARSRSIFDNEPPVIDLRLCSHTFDCEILRMGVEFNDRLIATEPMSRLLPVPPTGLKTQDLENRNALMETIKTMVRTEFHPSGTAAMMPRSAGGVVDTNLRVYGTTNLRVVDASIMPLIPGGHIQAAIYAVAEKVLSRCGYHQARGSLSAALLSISPLGWYQKVAFSKVTSGCVSTKEFRILSCHYEDLRDRMACYEHDGA